VNAAVELLLFDKQIGNKKPAQYKEEVYAEVTVLKKKFNSLIYARR
jgi:hypothetical protein